MPLDRTMIGATIPPLTAAVEASQLRLFAKATGESNPIYFSSEAARAAGYRAAVAPPTFLFGLNLAERDEAIPMLERLGGDPARALHGTQRFVYHRLAHAGDVLAFTGRITDIYAKAGGRLELFDSRTEVRNAADGGLVADLLMTIVVRNG